MQEAFPFALRGIEVSLEQIKVNRIAHRLKTGGGPEFSVDRVQIGFDGDATDHELLRCLGQSLQTGRQAFLLIDGEVSEVWVLSTWNLLTLSTGAFGANTGIQDAHNLAWKLAAVLNGQATPALLATYEDERGPVARFTAEQVILVSANKDTEKIAREAGADGFLAKPFELDELLVKLEHFL